MIRLGLRLGVGGGREALVRLVVTAFAVALGVGLLLASLASLNAVNKQAARGAWLNQGPTRASSTGASQQSALWWRSTNDEFAGRTITRIDVAATGPRAPVPPGFSRLPGPGEYVVSPALATLLRATPATELADRYPGHEVGVIGAAGVPNPDSLIVVVGHRPEQLSGQPGAFELTSISEHNPANDEQYLVVLAVAALALLFPVLVFLGTATRLSAARREQRFAAMRLVGATPRQISTIAVVEATAASLGGTALGFVLFVALRPALQHVAITGAPFAPGDLSLDVGDVVLVALGVPLAAALAARFALRRVVRSPLGVRSRVSPRPLRSLRLLPLAAGLIWMSVLAIVGRPGGKAAVYSDFLGALLLMAGLVIAGPWLTSIGAGVASKRTNRTEVLLAGRRLTDDPRAAFRSISGLVVALFVTSATTGVVSTIVADHGAPAGGAVAVGTLTDVLGDPMASSIRDQHSIPALPGGLVATLRAVEGVLGVTEIRWDPANGTLGRPGVGARGVLPPALGAGAALPPALGAGAAPPPAQLPAAHGVSGLVSCAQLARTPALGRCAAGAAVAVIEPRSTQASGFANTSDLAGRTWPSASLTARRLRSLPVEEVAIGTDGSTAAIETARTDLEVALPSHGQAPLTMGETLSATTQTRAELGNVANVIIAASLVIAGCSLAVGVTAGVSDRKRPFSLLRLAGVPVGTLRRVVALEAAVPLVLAAVLAAGVGLLGAELFLRAQLSVSLRWPGMLYFLVVVVGVVASLGVIVSTLPLIDRITGPSEARSE